LIGAAFLPAFDGAFYFVVLVTLFFIVVANYLFRNHRRMLTIKREIVAQQDAMGFTQLYEVLSPHKWISKKSEEHLGTMSYLFLLLAEVLLLWYLRVPNIVKP
jgi:hypothetical protein